uniref:Uncharacterized protein n=1 Tax=Anopheles quadriannulatus TaxID=34691 RepID=A0A182XLG9_ANOQN
MAPMYASMDEPEHQASNLVAHVVVIPNGSEGHITPGTTPTTTTTKEVEEEVEILNTPCALKGELEQATDPPVVITPKPNRSSRREKDRKRKSRSKSHSSRSTSTETSKETTPITTPALTVAVTESLSTYVLNGGGDDHVHYNHYHHTTTNHDGDSDDDTAKHYSDNCRRDFRRQNIANRHITTNSTGNQ